MREPVTVGDIRKLIPKDCTIWIEDENGSNLYYQSNEYLPDNFDKEEVIALYPQRIFTLGGRNCIVITI